jgi:SagB-type dehydrogenase family enzyme
MELNPVAPIVGDLAPKSGREGQDTLHVQLAPSCMLRIEDGAFVLESGPSLFRATLKQPGLVALANMLVVPRTGAPWRDDPPEGLTGGEAAQAVDLWLEAGLAIGDSPPLDERAYWSDWEALFHARSRVGRSSGGYGGTFRYRDITPPAPGVPPRRGGEVLPLPQVDLAQSPSASLVDVVARRQTIRRHNDEQPITVNQLGELLYRSQRLLSLREVPTYGDIPSRPYPAGGSLYELEIYPIIQNCAGLAPGLYHYLSDAHALEAIATAGPSLDALVELSRLTANMDTLPQVILILSARFPRVMWKYEGVSYAVILKDVGVLQQTLYLHATDLDLAPCALGGGDSDLFNHLIGSDNFIETSVGEFVVGSRPADWARQQWPLWYRDPEDGSEPHAES